MGAAEDHEFLQEFAENFGLDEQETEEFIGWAMLKKGYKRIASWMDNDDNDNSNQNALPFTQGKQRERRTVGGGNKPPARRASNGGDWQYGGGR